LFYGRQHRRISVVQIRAIKRDVRCLKDNLKMNQYRTALNRSYYSIFHAMRAANLMEGFDSSKHSGVIAFFNQNFIKEGKLDKQHSKIVKDASYLREKSDYDDFYIASKDEAEKQCKMAQFFLEAVQSFIKMRN
jgi:uncharacterized protein (UPF0332 family)